MDAEDNPHLVFESLNAKGRPLTQADLIRNYFFMRIHPDHQDKVYGEYWQPMQQALDDKLTEYIRHFLMKDGAIVKQSDVYYSLKGKVTPANAIEYLKELHQSAVYYQRLLSPDDEPDTEIKKYFNRLNRIEVTTAYPLLLKIYDLYANKKVSKDVFVSILKTLENFLIRRFVCSLPTNTLNKTFAAINPIIFSKYLENSSQGLRIQLQSKGYPKDADFSRQFRESRLYGAGDRQVKTKLILETIEESFGHKELVTFENLTIEHIMPQTLSEWWQNYLGDDWTETHDFLLHTIGNLTLTAYNTELSNDSFPEKRKTYLESHLDLNKDFASILEWKRPAIEERANILVKKALEIWPYFGQENNSSESDVQVTGTTPVKLNIWGQDFEVDSWRDVLERTLNTIADLAPEKFEEITKEYPRYVGKDKNRFKAIRELENGYFVEVHLSAKMIENLCRQAMETIEVTTDEWRVYTQRP